MDLDYYERKAYLKKLKKKLELRTKYLTRNSKTTYSLTPNEGKGDDKYFRTIWNNFKN